MYSYIKGIYAGLEDDKVVIDVNGIGYLISVASSTLLHLPEKGEPYMLYTYQIVREDALELAGFSTREEKQIFLKLLSISGIGPKAALAILSVLSPSSLISAVMTNDYKAIARANGVGPKMAQKVVLELKDKVDMNALNEMVASRSSNIAAPAAPSAEALQALIALGYTTQEASTALAGLEDTDTSVLIRNALKKLSSKI